MHRATSKQLKVEMGPVDVLHDILEPVGGMLHQRGGRVKVVLDCPKKNLFVMADALRLKQVILNLGRNSAKFVERGFIRLRAKKTETGRIQLMVEDTGPGIPKEKGERLFNKYQESLDVLSQGTVSSSFCSISFLSGVGSRIFLTVSLVSFRELVCIFASRLRSSWEEEFTSTRHIILGTLLTRELDSW
jgi:phosphoglycerate-specific signal transduction histidine kinase